MSLPATARQETPVFFPAGGEQIFAVVTEPVTDPLGVAVLIAMAGGFQTSTHVNRFAVGMARSLAGDGYHAMRIDYHGLGESSGSLPAYRMDQPLVTDIEGAVRWFRARGVERFVMVGSCMGARSALATASRTDAVESVVLISTPLIDLRMGEGTPARRMVGTSMGRYVSRGFRPRVLRRFFPPYSFRRQGRIAAAHLRLGARVAWRRLRARLAGERSEGLEVSPQVVTELETMVRRQVPVLFVYGDRDPFRSPFTEGGSRRIARLAASAGGLIEMTTVEGEQATRHVEGQTEIVRRLGVWLARHRRDNFAAAPHTG